MLKLAQEGSDNEKIALLQSLLEDANRRKNELETENRLEGGVVVVCCCVNSQMELLALLLWIQVDQSAADGGAESDRGAAEESSGAGLESRRCRSTYTNTWASHVSPVLRVGHFIGYLQRGAAV